MSMMSRLNFPPVLRKALVAICACATLVFGLSFKPAGAQAVPGARARPHIDAAQLLPRLYDAGNAAPLWRDADQVKQALGLLRGATLHGLDPASYDVEALAARLDKPDPAETASVDRALSQAMLQYLADLHFGRVKPDFQLPDQNERLKQFDPVAHLRDALEQRRLPEAVGAAAPAIPNYQRVQATLAQYREKAALAALSGAWTPPPTLPLDGKLVAGKLYPGLGLLRQRLQLLGDLDAAAGDADPDRHGDDLAQATKRFQSRHGLAETGYLGRDTLAALGVPLGQRVRQLELTLERLRWMPKFRPGRIIVVNVAAYRLWAFDTAAGAASEPLEMRVIVGKAARTQTPLFIGQMSYLEFNPYWNVPRSITLGEIIPKMTRNPGYLAQNNMEMVSASGKIQPPSIAALRSGALRVRQRPGPHNVLGAVKFAMPNPMNIYLHSTSAKELFGKTRRDLSHGCIRVERPAELAEFVLADQLTWSRPAIDGAMAPGPMRTVRLKETIPVVLFYATAATDRSGRAIFADDIYRRDARLIQALGAR